MCVSSLRRNFLRWCMIGKRGRGRRPRTWYEGETVMIERLTVHSYSAVECQSTSMASSRQSTSTMACCKRLNTAFWSVSWWLIYFTYKSVLFFTTFSCCFPVVVSCVCAALCACFGSVTWISFLEWIYRMVSLVRICSDMFETL